MTKKEPLMMLDRVLASDRWVPIFGVKGRHVGHRAERVRFDHMLRSAVAFDIQNVADYVSRNQLLAKHWSTFRCGGVESVADDPAGIVCAPPFPLVWMEYCCFGQKASSVDDRIITIGGGEKQRQSVGWLMHTFDLEDQGEREQVEHALLGVSPDKAAFLSQARWLTIATMWQLRRNNPYTCAKVNLVTGPDFQVQMMIDKDGKLLSRDLAPYFNRHHWNLATFPDVKASDWGECFSKFVAPMFATTFMACRNVAQEAVPSSAKADKAWRKRTGHPRIVKRHLVLDGKATMRGRTGGEPSGESADRRLHICRGHFRHYTASKPLFGHYVGPIWVPAHTRGSDHVGTIEKTYEVRP